MDSPARRFRDRLLPAILVATSVSLLAGGLWDLAGPTDAGGRAGGSAGTAPSAAGGPWTVPSSATAGGSASASASPDPSATKRPGKRVATRVAVPALGIDLPVVAPLPGSAYPYCDVAMYFTDLSQPGQPGATYIYAHARVGMFLPLLTASQQDNGSAMVGMIVEVYTSDDRLFLYEITQVRRHQLTLDAAFTARTSQLWLQTSEGPKGTPQKLQIVAKPLSEGPADHAAAHPVPHPLVCG